MPSAGPKAGRGLFSNWGLSERDRELAELKAFHARMQAEHNTSPLCDPARRDREVYETFREVFARCEIEPNENLLRALYGPVEALIEAEFFSFPEVRDPDWDYFDLKTKAELRNTLLLQERLYGDIDYRLDLGRRVIGAITAGLLRDIAEDGLGQYDDSNTETAPLVFTTSLIDLAEDARGAVEALYGTLLNGEEVTKADLFKSLCEQLVRNLLKASGYDERNPAPIKRFINPADAKDKSAPVLVSAYLGGTPFEALFEAPLPVVVPDRVRTEHALIVGGSGHGKTQLLLKLIHHDLTQKGDTPPGVIVIDSQGDLIHTLSRLALFDPERARSLSDRLIIIDPNDVEFPAALNLFAFDHARMDSLPRADKERVLHSVIDLYEYFFSALLGAELTQKQGVVFRYLARLMLAIPDATIQTLRALMEDGRPFKPYMESLDGSARRFFATEFFSPGFRATKQQILRRLWGVLANPVFERMFSHPENRIDLFEAMNEGKIILINTAKDLLKAENCSIFGRFFIAKIAQAALERATLAESERRTSFVYIDEAHDYFDETLEQLFNQARKYGVGLHVAVQNLDQMPSRLRSTVMASTAIKFAGGVSAKDARALSDDMHIDADFIRAMRKRRGVSEFAAFIKNRTAHAIRINVELGAVQSLPVLDEAQFTALMNRNRALYCAPIETIETIIAEEAEENPSQDIENAKPKVREAQPPQEPIQPAKIPPEAHTPPSSHQKEPAGHRQDEIDRYIAGVGGQRHKRLQELVRNLAHGRGFMATIEKRIAGGKSIDIALERDDTKLAVEISDTTDTAHELANVQKCFHAGYQSVVLICADAERAPTLSPAIKDALAEEQRPAFSAMSMDQFAEHLDRIPPGTQPTETTIRGYRVTTQIREASADEVKHRQSMIAQVLSKSVGDA